MLGRASRNGLAWRLSNTMDVQFCVDAPEDSLARYDAPEIVNTDRGRQSTSWAWTHRLREAACASPWMAKAGIGRWVEFYNHRRPGGAHGGKTPV